MIYSGAEILCEGFWNVCPILSWYSQGRTCKLKPSVRLGVVHKFFDWPDIEITSRLLRYHLIMAGHFVSVIARRASWKLHWPCKNLLQFTFICFYLACSSSDSYIAILDPGLVIFNFILICSVGQGMSIVETGYTDDLCKSNCHLACSLVACGGGLLSTLVVMVCRAECPFLSINSQVYTTHSCSVATVIEVTMYV